MSTGEPNYQPPAASLERPAPPRPASVLRALVAGVGGFALDVAATNVLGVLLLVIYYFLSPDGEFRNMDFGDWATSLQNPWAVADFVCGTVMSVLGGYVAARFAFTREGVAFGAASAMHFYYVLAGDFGAAIEFSRLDWDLFAQITVVNCGATFVGVWLRRIELERTAAATTGETE